jgi:gluconate kinase
MIHFLVGPMGAGKNYVGELLAEKLNCKFIDGDDFLPKELKEKIFKFKPLSKSDLNNFIKEHLIPKVEQQSYIHPDLVIAQALYRREHREIINKHFKGQCRFIKIKTPLVTNLKRLLTRKKGIRWALYGLINRPFFQGDDVFECMTINNGESKRELMEDINKVSAILNLIDKGGEGLVEKLRKESIFYS